MKKTFEMQKEPEKPVDAKLPISMPASEIEAAVLKREIRLFDQQASAGLGKYLSGEDTYETISVDADKVPDKADFGVLISGHSMEPYIPDKSIVWVKERHQLDSGQIGVFALSEDNAYCKKLKIDYDKREIYLLSINPAYEPIRIPDENLLRTIGLVIGEPYIF